MARLTDFAVRQARLMVKDGSSVATVAEAFGVDFGELVKAVSGETFKHIEDPLPVDLGRDGQRNATLIAARRAAAARARSKPAELLPVHAQRIRDERWKLGLSQQGFAHALRTAGREIGLPNACTKRLVQKWETGEHSSMRPAYQLAFKHLTGVDYVALCTAASPPNPEKATQELGECITRLAEIGRDLTEFHARLLDLHGYVTRDPASFLAITAADS